MKIHVVLVAAVVGLSSSALPASAQIERPILSSAQLPFYPFMARVARVQGTVFLDVTLSPTGEVSHVEVISGNPLLKKDAQASVESWKVRWATIVPSPKHPVHQKVEFVYRLSDEPGPADAPLHVTVVGIERVIVETNTFRLETNTSKAKATTR